MKTKLLKLDRKEFSEISDTKGGEPIFQVWGGGKKGGGNSNFSKIKGEGTRLSPTVILIWTFEAFQLW